MDRFPGGVRIHLIGPQTFAKKGFYVKMDKKDMFQLQKVRESVLECPKGMIPVKGRPYQYQLIPAGLFLDLVRHPVNRPICTTS